jgi:hypothetical protein
MLATMRESTGARYAFAGVAADAARRRLMLEYVAEV